MEPSVKDQEEVFFSINVDNIVSYTQSEFLNTVFQFCSENFVNLPCFCYHNKLSIAGNCRICMAQINNILGISCALAPQDNMVISTESKRVRNSRESILEFLLVNHPLDCPICDRGGECDLQDITLSYGNDRGRFYELSKRGINNVNFDFFVKTIMTRCIHCTRCTRFLYEIAGDPNLGIAGRGVDMEISPYIVQFLVTEFSGNIIDLCPVGALTSTSYAFIARPWELSFRYSVDILDCIASSICINFLNNTILRILPSLDETLNEV